MFQNTYNNYNTSLSDDSSLKIIREFESSGISQEVFDLNVQIVDDIEIDPVTNEVTATPIADLLGYRYTRFGHSHKENITAAVFTQENGGVWQLKIFEEENDGKRSGKYMAPKDIEVFCINPRKGGIRIYD